MSARLGCLLLVLIAWPGVAIATDTGSANFRLVGSGPASTSARVQSPQFQLRVVGGSGQPVGISASTNASVVAGGASTALPTDRILVDGLENPP